MHDDRPSVPAFSLRWTVAGIAAAAVAVAGAALAWHERAHATGPAQLGRGASAQAEPGATGARVETMSARRKAGV